MANLDLNMIAQFKDKATSGLKKVQRNVDVVKKSIDKLNQAASKFKGINGGRGTTGGTTGGSRAGSTAAAGIGALAAAGLGAGTATALQAVNKLSGETKIKFEKLTEKSNGLKASMNELALMGVRETDRWMMKYKRTLEAVEKEKADLLDTTNKGGGRFSQFSYHVKSAGSKVKDFFNYIKWTTAAVAAGVTAVILIGKKFEKLKATLSTVLPEGIAVGDAFALIQKITKQIPSSLEETTQAFNRLISLGIMPTEERMLAFSNIASANGKTLLQFAEAAADALTGEFERLKEFGLKVSKETDGYVARMGDVVVASGTTTTELLNNIEAIGRKGGKFAEGNARQMDTLDGKLSNLGVAWSNLADNIYTSGVDTAVKWVTDQATKFVIWLNQHWVKFLKEINHVSAGFKHLGAVMIWVKDRFKAAAGAMSFEEADAKFDKAVANIYRVRDAANAEAEALLDVSEAAKRANDQLKEREKGGISITITPSDFDKWLQEVHKGVTEAIKIRDYAMDALQYVDEQFQQGNLTAEQYAEWNARLNDMLEMDAQETAENVEGWWQQAANNMQDTMGNVFFDWMQGQMTSLSEAFKQMIDRMVAELIASNIMSFLFGNFGSTGQVGGFFGSFGGGRAEGGPVTGGTPYLIGEQGPELFVPSTSGNVVSNKALESAGRPQINMNFQSLDPQENFRIFEQNARRIAELVNTTNATYNLRTA